ncbi:HAD-IC family P-type ATPase [candidate division KSB1 bacterium]|nr:HAD-IC family P-type ATPase [candidate division KSB1 bacterium]
MSLEKNPDTNTTPWYTLKKDNIYEQLDTSPEGLTSESVQKRLEKYGPNELEAESGPSLWKLILKQLRSPLIYILLGATALSLAMQHYTDAGVIFFIVIFNTVLGIIQEYRAEKALSALYELTAPHARVIREDKEHEIEARDVVPGDVVILKTGSRVPADARLIESEELQIDESALTGESDPAQKEPGSVEKDTPLADQHNMVFMSTAVTNGWGKAIVVSTGMDSQMGEIAGQVRETKREETPLQKRLAGLAKILGISGIGLGVVLFGLGLLRGHDIVQMALFSVALAVSAIPEGLPAVISVTLALGVKRMTKRGSIVRRLPAVETLGSTTVICSDKTGTITRNEMTVTRVWAGNQTITLTGEGYVPEGQLFVGEETLDPADYSPALEQLVHVSILNNDSKHEKDDEWTIEGDPTEAALLVLARKAGKDPDELRQKTPRIDEIPFSSKYKYMATLHKDSESGYTLYVKGAPEQIMQFCDRMLDEKGDTVAMNDDTQQSIKDQLQDMANDALRPLAMAMKPMDQQPDDLQAEHVESGLIFLGLTGMVDPPRKKAIEAIEKAQKAGIRVIMITGDQPDTARAVAQKAGIELASDTVLTGVDLDDMSDEDLQKDINEINVFARVSPSHKLRIVSALQNNKEIVAMTGDGVNDAPALKSVDIGVAMGGTGTEVAKEAAEMVLTKDDFATIVDAIEEGRVIYNNLKRVAFFLLTTSLAEVLTLGISLMIGLPLPLTAVMILWINLISDVPADIPLGIEPKHWDVLKQPPRPPDEPLLTTSIIRRMFLLAPVVAAGTLLMYYFHLPNDWQSNEMYPLAQTIAFTTLAAFQWFQAILSRSSVLSVFSIGFFRNRWLMLGISTAILLQLAVVYTPFGHTLFQTQSIPVKEWLLILPVAASVWVFDEILKQFHVHGRPPKNHKS